MPTGQPIIAFTVTHSLCLLTGWLSDVTGDYDMTFCVAGAVILLSGIMLFLVPYVRKFDRAPALPDVSIQIVHSTSKDNAAKDTAAKDNAATLDSGTVGDSLCSRRPACASDV